MYEIKAYRKGSNKLLALMQLENIPQLNTHIVIDKNLYYIDRVAVNYQINSVVLLVNNSDLYFPD